MAQQPGAFNVTKATTVCYSEQAMFEARKITGEFESEVENLDNHLPLHDSLSSTLNIAIRDLATKMKEHQLKSQLHKEHHPSELDCPFTPSVPSAKKIPGKD